MINGTWALGAPFPYIVLYIYYVKLPLNFTIKKNTNFKYLLFSVIWIVMSHARMRSVTNYFIVNLSIADILNATLNVIPNFTYMLTGNWPFGES